MRWILRESFAQFPVALSGIPRKEERSCRSPTVQFVLNVSHVVGMSKMMWWPQFSDLAQNRIAFWVGLNSLLVNLLRECVRDVGSLPLARVLKLKPSPNQTETSNKQRYTRGDVRACHVVGHRILLWK